MLALNFFNLNFKAGWLGRRSSRVFAVAVVFAFSLGLEAQVRNTKAPPRVTKFQQVVRNYADVVKFMKDMTAKYPKGTRMFDLGPSDSGEMIQGLAIGDGSVNNLVVATHHGNEYGSTAVAMAFANHLAAAPIPGQTIYVVPVLNIYGYNRGMRTEQAQGRLWDPNRNYPGPCGTQGPFTLKSTYALAEFIKKANIVTSATLHTYFPGALYPWGISTKDTKTLYDDIFISLGQAATLESKYVVGNSTELLYAADGTFEDYAFWAHGIWSMLFELGYSHFPSDKDIETMIRVNVPGLRRMFENAPKVRAPDHAFKGKCDDIMRRLNLRHD